MSRVVRVIAFILSVLCMALIAYLSLSSNVSFTKYVVGGDKGGHYLAYTALSMLFFICFANFAGRRLLRRNLLSLLGAFALAFVCSYCIELIQPYFHRTFELADLVAGALGCLTGVVVGFVFVLLVCVIERRLARR